MKKFICILEENVANELSRRGFFCVEEKINKDQKVYKFLTTPKLKKALSEQFSDYTAIETDTLTF